MEVTPIGRLTGFTAIERPSTKFDDNGVYSCQVAFKGEGAKAMKKLIDGYMEKSLDSNKSVKKAANPPYSVENKELIVKFKQKARIVSRSGEVYEKDVKIFDAANEKVNEPLFMGEDSQVRVAFNPYMWQVPALGCGVTLQLEMVQVIELVKREGGGGNPFEEMEGFVAAKKDVNPFDGGPTKTVQTIVKNDPDEPGLDDGDDF